MIVLRTLLYYARSLVTRSDDLQNREHCWNTASLCDKNRKEGQQQLKATSSGSKGGGSRGGSAIGILHRVHRCLSSSAIPIPASMTIASPSLASSSAPLPASEPATFYQSYSCDDLYLASDLSPSVDRVDPISEQSEQLDEPPPLPSSSPPHSSPSSSLPRRSPQLQPDEAEATATEEFILHEIDLAPDVVEAVCITYIYLCTCIQRKTCWNTLLRNTDRHKPCTPQKLIVHKYICSHAVLTTRQSLYL